MSDSEPFSIDFAGRVRLLQAYEAYAADVGKQTERYQLAGDLRKQHKKPSNDPSLLCVCEDILEYHEIMEEDIDEPMEPVIWNLYQRHRLILHRKTRHHWTRENAIAWVCVVVYLGMKFREGGV